VWHGEPTVVVPSVLKTRTVLSGNQPRRVQNHAICHECCSTRLGQSPEWLQFPATPLVGAKGQSHLSRAGQGPTGSNQTAFPEVVLEPQLHFWHPSAEYGHPAEGLPGLLALKDRLRPAKLWKKAASYNGKWSHGAAFIGSKSMLIKHIQ